MKKQDQNFVSLGFRKRSFFLCFFNSLFLLFFIGPRFAFAFDAEEAKRIDRPQLCGDLVTHLLDQKPELQSGASLFAALIQKANAIRSSLRNQLGYDLNQLQKPNWRRDEKDPRGIVTRLTSSEPSPTDEHLKDEMQHLRPRLELLERLIAVGTELSQMQVQMSSQSDPAIAAAYNQGFVEVLDRLNRYVLNLETLQVHDVSSAESDVQTLGTELKADPELESKLVSRLYDAASHLKIVEAHQLATQILQRPIQERIASAIFSLSMRLKIPEDQILGRFKEIIKYSRLERPDLDDAYVFLLTQMSLMRQASPESVVRDFEGIAHFGNTNTPGNFALGLDEAAPLTDLAIATKQSPEEIMKVFFVFENLGATTVSDYEITAPALAVLTELKYRYPKLTPEELIKSYLHINSIAESRPYPSGNGSETFDNDLATALLLSYTLDNHIEPEVAIDQLFELKTRLNSYSLRMTDEDLARLIRFAALHNLSLETLASTYDRMIKITETGQIDPERFMTSMSAASASSAVKPLTSSNIKNADLRSAMWLRNLRPMTLLDHLTEDIGLTYLITPNDP